MQTALVALIVLAAAGVLIYRLWRTARGGTSCSCGSDCHGCDGCPGPREWEPAARPRKNGTARRDDYLPISQSSS